MRKLVVVSSLLLLAACAKKGEESADRASPAAPAPAAAAEGKAAPRADAPLPVSVPQLAYSYKYALAAPPARVRGLVSKHEQACWDAGPTVCQVTGSNVTEDGPDKIAAVLTLRAQPQWLRAFRTGLEVDTKAAGGRMINADTASDDLSRNLVDTEAELRAKTVLADRLEVALRTRGGKVSDVFEMERQLATVRGEIDAARSELAMMRTRVAASELRIDYRSEGVMAPSGSLAPVSQAASEVVGTLMFMLAFLIRLLTVIGPLAALGGLAWWITRRVQRRGPAPKTPTA